MDRVSVYTDGCCKGNPGAGGWGVVIVEEGRNNEEVFAGETPTTNNRMELTAAIRGATHPSVEGKPILLISDSKYVLDGIQSWSPGWIARGWKTSTGSAVANRDLWEPLLAAIKNADVKFQWVKGHQDNEGNNRADELSNQGAFSVMTPSQKEKYAREEQEMKSGGFADKGAYYASKYRGRGGR